MHPFLQQLLAGQAVEWKPLGEVCHSIKTGLNPRQFFQLNTDDATNYYVTIRELQNHQIVFTDKTDKINDEALRLCNNRSNLEVDDILFSGTGTIGTVALVNENPNNWNIKEGVYAIKPMKNKILSKFLLYLFESEKIRNDFLSKSAGGTVKSVPMKELAKVLIPIPPLSVQTKIAQILDTMTAITAKLTAELTAELSMRNKQYQYYRDQLLSENELAKVGFEWKSLGDVFDIFAGGDVPKEALSETRTDEFNIPILSNGVGAKSLYGWTNQAKIHKPSLTISARGTIGWTSIQLKPFFPIVRLLALTPKIDVNLKYLYYYMKNIENSYKVNESGIPQLTKPMIRDISIPIPPLAEQARIVAILDKFDTLTQSISDGLPREIELRQQQYAYYREVLLGFGKE